MALLHEIWLISNELAPWLLGGLLAAGLMHCWLPPDFIHRHLGASTVWDTIKAVLIGIPLPLCSCAVIPTAAALHKDGASRGATVGFMISTPQTGIDSIAVSAALLGWPFALFKVVSALITGVVGGWLTNVIAPAPSSRPLRTPQQPTTHSRLPLRNAVSYALDELLPMLWRWLVIGIVAAALISAYVPTGVVSNTPWLQGPRAMVLALIISLPMYVCATSSVPIAASLVALGMPTGAALVFLMAGPASNLATVGAVGRVLGYRALVVYLSVVAFGSILFAMAFETVFSLHSTTAAMHQHSHITAWSSAATIALGVAMLRCAWHDIKRRPKASSPDATIVIHVDGMTCQGCERRVTSVIENLDGVDSVHVDFDSGTAHVASRVQTVDEICAAVNTAGFRATIATSPS